MRVAVIYRPRNAAPVEATPVLMGALAQWVETYAEPFATLEFFVAGGGMVADFADSADLMQFVAENPFTPFSDVEILPAVAPSTAMATYSRVVETLAAVAAPAG